MRPAEGVRMSGADVLVHTLVDLGVKTIFGYSGGAILPAFDAIFRFNDSRSGPKDSRPPVDLVVPANEQGAGFMAAGYARASGNPGVFLVTSGPGATNAVTPIRDCMADSIPVVMISGQVPRHAIGTDAFQEAPIFNIMSSCAKHVFLVKDPGKLEMILRTAFQIATTGRPGPVVVDIPKDIQTSEIVYTGKGEMELKGYRSRLEDMRKKRLTVPHCKRFFKVLSQAKRPLLYLGGGVIHANAASEVRRFVERYQVPVVTTLMGISTFSTKHHLNLHMLGMHGTAYANYAVEDCDLLIALGARFDDRVAGCPDKFAPNARAIMHIDIDHAEIDKIKTTTWHYHGNLAPALRILMDNDGGHRSDLSAWHKHVAKLKRQHRLNYDHNSELVQPYYVLEELNRLLKGNAIITTGVGQHQMWAAQYLDYEHPRTWLTSGSMGTMGFGLPAAIGAQFACPERQVYDIDGDGSLRMNIGELETVTTYELPIKILLLNNDGDGMVRQWQKVFFEKRFVASDKSLRRKDFMKAVLADGFEFSRRIDKKSQVQDVLKAFVDFPGPAFLEVKIDRDAGVYPMVSPGQGYSQMITGEHIKKRPALGRDEPTETDPISSTEMF